MKNIFKYLFLFLVGGSVYYGIENIWRGYSHWTMFTLGGICFLYAGIQNEFTKWEQPLWIQAIKVDLVVLILEFITGCIVNLWLGWEVWDYSHLSLNLFGQTSLLFALLFLPLCLIAIILDDYIRYFIFHEEKPHYKFI